MQTIDPEQRDDRVRIARERAGLSISQAAGLLGITCAEYKHIEDPMRGFVSRANELADLFGVNVEWLCGHVPLRDYEAIRKIKGSENLLFHDLDELAMFAASMARRAR